MTAALWRAVAAGLLVLLVVTAIYTGAGWWLAARDRDRARVELVEERRQNVVLRASIAVQNSAVNAMQLATAQADARGQAAQVQAAAAGRRYDAALARLVPARATTCAEAMPAVNQLLEDVR